MTDRTGNPENQHEQPRQQQPQQSSRQQPAPQQNFQHSQQPPQGQPLQSYQGQSQQGHPQQGQQPPQQQGRSQQPYQGQSHQGQPQQGQQPPQQGQQPPQQGQQPSQQMSMGSQGQMPPGQVTTPAPQQQAGQPRQASGMPMQQSQTMETQGAPLGNIGARTEHGSQQPQLQPANIEQILQTDVETVQEDTPVATGVAQMESADVGSIVVLDEEQRPTGILTDRKVALSVEEMTDIGEREVSELIDSEPVTGTADMNIYDIIQLLSEHSIRRLPIVDESDELQGIVTLDDIIVLLAAELNTVAEIIKAQSPRL